jgi:hypothetical protein
MAMYSVPKELIDDLAQKSASPEEIKETFRSFFKAQAVLPDEPPKEPPKEVMERLEAFDVQLKDIVHLCAKIGSDSSKRDSIASEQYKTLLERMDKLPEQLKAAAPDEAVEADVPADTAGPPEEDLKKNLEERKYPLRELSAWKKLQGQLPGYEVKRLAFILQALDAGIMPSKLLPYLDSSLEQLELVIFILTKEIKEETKEEIKEGDKVNG